MTTLIAQENRDLYRSKLKSLDQHKFPNFFPMIIAAVRLRAKIDQKGRIYSPVHRIAKPNDIIVIEKTRSPERYAV